MRGIKIEYNDLVDHLNDGDKEVRNKGIKIVEVACPDCGRTRRHSVRQEGITSREMYCANYIGCERGEYPILGNITAIYERKGVKEL